MLVTIRVWTKESIPESRHSKYVLWLRLPKPEQEPEEEEAEITALLDKQNSGRGS